MDCKILLIVGLFVLVKQSVCQTPNATDTTSSQTTPRPSVTTPPSETTAGTGIPATTLSPKDLCNSKHSCEDCIGAPGTKCLWCKSTSNCTLYPLSKVLPTDDCPLDQARWGVCWLNFEALIIGVSVVGGVIFLTITCCCVYCCCCRGGNKKKIDRDEARYNAQKMERQAKNNEKKTERKERLDEIRRKYGLMKDEPCQRFDA